MQMISMENERLLDLKSRHKGHKAEIAPHFIQIEFCSKCRTVTHIKSLIFRKKNNGVRFTRTSCVHHFEMITLDAGNHLTGNIVSQLDTCRRNRTEVDLNKCNQCTKIQCDWLTDFCVSIQQVTMKGHFNIWLLLSAFVLFQVNNKHDWLLNNKKMNEMKIYWNKADQEGKKTLTHTKKPNLTKQKKKW